MAYVFSNVELVDMILVYGETQQNALNASRLYAERFPNRHVPNPDTFVATVQRGRDTGSLLPFRGRDGGPGRPQRVLAAEDHILDLVDVNAHISTRQISRQTRGVSHSTVWRIMHENMLNAYHIQRVQALQPGDMPLRVQFCEWLLAQHRQNPRFTADILATDEATFTQNGMHNIHNTHVWAFENPHAIREGQFQGHFSLNVWAGIVADRLIGPFVLPNRMDGLQYLDFLENNLPGLLEEVPLDVRARMWFLHDGAPPHFRRVVRDYLDRIQRIRWIGRGGPVPWPPRSPDLNPLDFFLWGHLKNEVYTTEVRTIDELRERITAATNNLRMREHHEGGTFTLVRQNWVRRAEACIQVVGNHFEQLL